MRPPNPEAEPALSDSDRVLLRKSVRDLLSARWPAEKAVQQSVDSQQVVAIWRALAEQGLAALGSNGAEAGLREILLVFEEFGRAACPAPLIGAVAANIVLATQQSDAVRALLEDIHQGQAIVALALGAFDGDLAAGQATMRGGRLSGTISFVEDVQAATHVLVVTDTPTGMAIVDCKAAGIASRTAPGLAIPALSELTFENTPAMGLAASSEILAAVALLARLASAARALGAAERGFELAVDNAKVRKQFGQFIGQFQAIQHKLANGLISLDGARLALESAATAYDSGNPYWRVFASSALAFSSPALRTVSIETHRALGAIGYAEEHEAPRHFRRVHADLARFGGVSRARAELADAVLGPIG
ncbi:acyl-CoA dehydrogenase family protein [Rhodoplanes sp. Z2-YC6860]|uniref:acyl-CoA dehydrogenase family protein n=1 Tax=Rhodoplanes sp. Z2-YC6860 TaxID=674703 RepID=UPI00078D1762|nr:acyl-CoA dehydrogenase family protein [Rhodoplanes sp. Z2-YC6860]AMN44667.1 acyl-CoA dehydrogenase, N-terminal domain protein [Rhodoplanes sp. Z2-YC6860]